MGENFVSETVLQQLIDEWSARATVLSADFPESPCASEVVRCREELQALLAEDPVNMAS